MKFSGCVLLSIAGSALAITPLVQRQFPYNEIPYQADSDNGPRGTQLGFNRCNSTTQNQDSMCQTLVVNSYDDFCLWGAPSESVVGDSEGEMVAYCTKPDHGTRVIPDGALKGVQFIRTPHYVQVTGFIDQTAINLKSDDSGGELDPHGADQRGNPLGGLVYSTAFGHESRSTAINGSEWTQATEWTNFLGSNMFCLKVCDPNYKYDSELCNHVYDRIGCQYNMPAAYENNTFEYCQGDDQLPPGVYVGDNGRTSTWYQPPETDGPISTIPYTPAKPKSSSCMSFDSASAFAAGTGALNGSAISSGPTSGVSSTSGTSSSSVSPTSLPGSVSSSSGSSNSGSSLDSTGSSGTRSSGTVASSTGSRSVTTGTVYETATGSSGSTGSSEPSGSGSDDSGATVLAPSIAFLVGVFFFTALAFF